MVRITRSQNTNVANDQTELASQTALPVKLPLARFPLGEIMNHGSEDIISVEEYALEQQLKELKAAYKSSFCGKETRKGRNRLMEKRPDTPARLQTATDENQEPYVTSCAEHDATNIADSDEGSLKLLLQAMENFNLTTSQGRPAITGISTAPQPSLTRPTRQQTMQTQAGQFDYKAFLLKYPLHGTLGPHSDITPAINSPSYARSIRGWTTQNHACSAANLADQTSLTANESSDNKAEPKSLSIDEDGGFQILTAAQGSTALTLDEIEKSDEEMEAAMELIDQSEDSFVEVITTRSPAKPVSRFEDTVEALDKLEDAIEALDEVTIAQALISPEKRKTTPQSSAKDHIMSPTQSPSQDRAQRISFKKDATLVKTNAGNLGGRSANATLAETQIKIAGDISALKGARSHPSLRLTADRGSVNKTASIQTPLTKKPVERPASLLPPKPLVRSTKPPTVSDFELPGEAVARKLKERREARLAQREASEDCRPSIYICGSRASTIKSTKTLTKPEFELPGEALSKRKREANEARLKAQEEEDRKRREFKAKLPRKSSVPNMIPRDTIASLARKGQTGTLGSRGTETISGKRGSIIDASRPSILSPNRANATVPRASSAFAPNTSRKVSNNNGSSRNGLTAQRPVSEMGQKPAGKEIYIRDLKAYEDIKRAKLDREAAAKRSREEAAERGRQASRIWAQKQLAKRATAVDKGLGPGYGPGGQLGLKS